MDAKDISKKVRSTLIALKQKGKFLGSTPSYGYKKDPNNKYKLIPDKIFNYFAKFRMFYNKVCYQDIYIMENTILCF